LNPDVRVRAAQRLPSGDAADPSRPRAASSQRPADANASRAIALFLRSFYILLRAAGLYQRNHPRVAESLAESEHALRAALDHVSPVAFRIEAGRILLPSVGRASSADWLASYRSECEALAEELDRRGVSSMVFQPQATRADLDAVVQLLQRSAAKKSAGRGLSWESQFAARRIQSIRINVSLEQATSGALATLLAGLLSYGGSLPEEKPPTAGAAAEAPQTEADLTATVRLLARLAPLLHPGQECSPQAFARALQAALGDADRRSVALLAKCILSQAPRDAETPRLYLVRVGETLLLDFLSRECLAHRIAAPALRPAVARLAQVSAEILQGPKPVAAGGAIFPDWSESSYVEGLYARLWESLPAAERERVLRGRDAWCAPVAALRRTLEHLADTDPDGYPREARLLLLRYGGCLDSEDGKVRRAVAAGLAELDPLLRRLWPRELPAGLIQDVTAAVKKERSPGIAALLVTVTEKLARFALTIGDYEGYERILESLERAPRDEAHAHVTALLAKLAADPCRMDLVDAGVFARADASGTSSRQLDPALPRLLRRDPERVLERLDVLLAGPKGLDGLPAMARLLCAIGEPALGALETRLYEPRRQRAATAVKLLAAAEPQRLLVALPRAMPSWDWSLQDLAISELARPLHHAPLAGLTRVLLQTLPEAHPLVVPVLLDLIGQKRETAAVPVLMEIAAGSNERLRDIFIRIKAVEALGRMRVREAADLLRGILRQRNGLTHAEPAGLRTAAEEGLALLENHPSSVRVRTAAEALEKAGSEFMRARRYLRFPLPAPLPARIEGPAIESARVRTISLGGAYLELGRRLVVGDSLRVEIRSGLNRLRATAVVRNVACNGGGVEFVHMKAEDRERLRRLVRRLTNH
jgi:hypothetical protein